MPFTKVASVYPIWIRPLPELGLPGEWINLANVESFTFNPKTEKYLARFSSGAYRYLDPVQAKPINRALAKGLRGGKTEES